MKLTPENIEKIEEVLTCHEQGIGNRAIIIKFGFRDIPIFSSFLTCIRHLGVNLETHHRAKGSVVLPPEEAKEFLEWLREKRSERDARTEAEATSA